METKLVQEFERLSLKFILEFNGGEFGNMLYSYRCEDNLYDISDLSSAIRYIREELGK